MKRYIRAGFVGEPDPTGELEGQARYEQKFKSWRDVYNEFMRIVEEVPMGPGYEEEVEREVEKIYNRAPNNPYFKEAYRRWKEE